MTFDALGAKRDRQGRFLSIHLEQGTFLSQPALAIAQLLQASGDPDLLGESPSSVAEEDRALVFSLDLGKGNSRFGGSHKLWLLVRLSGEEAGLWWSRRVAVCMLLLVGLAIEAKSGSKDIVGTCLEKNGDTVSGRCGSSFVSRPVSR